MRSLFAFIFCLALYFFPTIVATLRETHNRNGIFLLNILIGWTGIGWIVVLVMACGSFSTFPFKKR